MSTEDAVNDEVPSMEEADFTPVEPAPEEPTAPPPEEPPPSPPTRKRPPTGTGTRAKRPSVAEKYKKESKPPSKAVFLVKKILTLGIPVAIVGLVAAGFFVKDGRGDRVWIGFLKRLGIVKSSKPYELEPTARRDTHPRQAAFDRCVGGLSGIETALRDLDKECGGDWTKEGAESVLAKVDAVLKKLDEIRPELEAFETWHADYFRDLKAAAEAYEAKDQARMKELDEKLERSKYRDVEVTPEEASTWSQKLNLLRRHANQIRASVPTPEQIAARTKKEEPKKTGPAPFDLAKLSFYAGIENGTWRRTEDVDEDTVLLSSTRSQTDVVYTTVQKDHVLVNLYRFRGGREVGPEEKRYDLAEAAGRLGGEERVSIQGVEREAQVVETNVGRRWILRGGLLPDRLEVQIEGEFRWEGLVLKNVSLKATAVEERSLPFRGTDLKCAYVELSGTADNKNVIVRRWFSETVPAGVVKVEIETVDEGKVSRTLIDFGPAPRLAFAGAEEKKEEKKEETKKEEPKKEEPKVELPEIKNPWATRKEGAWSRVKVTTTERSETRVRWEDETLVKIAPSELTFRNETLHADGQRTVETVVVSVEGPRRRVLGGETIEIAGSKYRCIIVDEGAEARGWIWAEGPYAGRLMLKREGPGEWWKVDKIQETSLAVGDKTIRCVHTQAENSNGSKTQDWYSLETPNPQVRLEIEIASTGYREIRELAAFGDGEKPPFPTKEVVPTEKSAETLLQEADTAITEGAKLYAEVLKACREGLPSEKEKLVALKEKADSAEKLLRGAVEGYGAAKARGAEASRVDETVARIGRYLTVLKTKQEQIRAKIAE